MLGVTFVGNTYIGPRITVEKLFAGGYDAVFLGLGTTWICRLGVPGENLPGVYKATDFLVRANVDSELLPHEMCTRPEVGKAGGGHRRRRHGVRLPAHRFADGSRRRSSACTAALKPRCRRRSQRSPMAVDEGAQYHFLTQPVRFIAGADGRLAQIECVRTVLGEPDESGRMGRLDRGGLGLHPGSADTAIMAIGYKPDPIISSTTPGHPDQYRRPAAGRRAHRRHHRKGVFTGGDVVTGPQLVVTAMAAGRKAAAAIDRYLGLVNPPRIAELFTI